MPGLEIKLKSFKNAKCIASNNSTFQYELLKTTNKFIFNHKQRSTLFTTIKTFVNTAFRM